MSRRRSVVAAAATLVTTVSGSAAAMQPLGAFLESSRQHNLDLRADAATLRQREQEEVTARRGLLPIVTGTGQYSFNQYEAKVSIPTSGSTLTAVITPRNEWDGS